MANQNFVRENSMEYKIKGQKRPFIDKNLQLQLPEIDSNPSEDSLASSHQKIYSHYSTYIQTTPSFLASKKNEVQTIMTEARSSYQAWSKMRDKIREKINHEIQIKNLQ